MKDQNNAEKVLQATEIAQLFSLLTEKQKENLLAMAQFAHLLNQNKAG